MNIFNSIVIVNCAPNYLLAQSGPPVAKKWGIYGLGTQLGNLETVKNNILVCERTAIITVGPWFRACCCNTDLTIGNWPRSMKIYQYYRRCWFSGICLLEAGFRQLAKWSLAVLEGVHTPLFSRHTVIVHRLNLSALIYAILAASKTLRKFLCSRNSLRLSRTINTASSYWRISACRQILCNFAKVDNPVARDLRLMWKSTASFGL